jgi:hypothetical protein
MLGERRAQRRLGQEDRRGFLNDAIMAIPAVRAITDIQIGASAPGALQRTAELSQGQLTSQLASDYTRANPKAMPHRGRAGHTRSKSERATSIYARRRFASPVGRQVTCRGVPRWARRVLGSWANSQSGNRRPPTPPVEERSLTTGQCGEAVAPGRRCSGGARASTWRPRIRDTQIYPGPHLSPRLRWSSMHRAATRMRRQPRRPSRPPLQRPEKTL